MRKSRPAADALLAKVTNSESQQLLIRLTWDGQADFDLTVEEPLGATAELPDPPHGLRRFPAQERIWGPTGRSLCLPSGFDGDYTIRISNVWVNPARPVACG